MQIMFKDKKKHKRIAIATIGSGALCVLLYSLVSGQDEILIQTVLLLAGGFAGCDDSRR